MGTNYFWRDRPCEHCGRFENIHMGKSGGIFRAWPHRLFNDAHPDWGYDPASPFGFPVLSLKDWERVFKERPGSLWDEYGREVTDPLMWLAGFEPWNEERRAKQDGWDADFAARFMASGPAEHWYDPDGFYFTAREFS